jgi:hypothetical protein
MRGRRGSLLWAGLVLLAGAGCPPPPVLPRSPEIGPAGVVFRYRAPAAQVVQVAGSWADNFALRGLEWTRDTRVGRLQDDDGDGLWEIVVPLGPGRYEYQFLVDGRFWENDPANPQRAPGAQGGQVSLLIVP